jgi:LemA protein
MNIPVLIAAGGALLIILWFIAVYNGLIRLRKTIDNAWADTGVFLQKRNDLIPNLVETLRGYVKHERGTLESVTKARQDLLAAPDSDRSTRIAAENTLTQTLRSLFAVAENYPNLKANEQYNGLSTALRELEDQIEGSRRYYNAVARDYNIRIKVIPNVLVALVIGAKEQPSYPLEDRGAIERPVKVSL